MKEFTREMLDKLTEAKDSVKGSAAYAKYHMEQSYNYNGRWKFGGWGIPNQTGVFKKANGKLFIVLSNSRFEVSEAVKELLNI